jgi:hypothetical protein
MANRDPDRERGPYKKYIVKRVDGSHRKGRKHEFCKYHVLDLDHDPYALPALKAYADACSAMYPKLAASIYEGLKRRGYSVHHEG